MRALFADKCLSTLAFAIKLIEKRASQLNGRMV